MDAPLPPGRPTPFGTTPLTSISAAEPGGPLGWASCPAFAARACIAGVPCTSTRWPPASGLAGCGAVSVLIGAPASRIIFSAARRRGDPTGGAAGRAPRADALYGCIPCLTAAQRDTASNAFDHAPAAANWIGLPSSSTIASVMGVPVRSPTGNDALRSSPHDDGSSNPGVCDGPAPGCNRTVRSRTPGPAIAPAAAARGERSIAAGPMRSPPVASLAGAAAGGFGRRPYSAGFIPSCSAFLAARSCLPL